MVICGAGPNLNPELAGSKCRTGFPVPDRFDHAPIQFVDFSHLFASPGYRALERLVAQKRLAKTAGVPCIVSKGETLEVEDSLAENVQRVSLLGSASQLSC